MKTYIYGLLRKKVFSNEANDEAKYLKEVLTQYYKEFHYTDFNSFECFYFHIPSDCPYYGFFHEYESQDERVVEGTPIHWRVVCYDKLQIWLS